MSSLTLDRTDPEIDALVSQWVDGETYTVTLTITQTGSDKKTASYDVTEVVSEEAPEEEVPPAAPAKSVPITYKK